MRNGDEFTKNAKATAMHCLLAANPGHLFSMLPTKLFWLYTRTRAAFMRARCIHRCKSESGRKTDRPAPGIGRVGHFPLLRSGHGAGDHRRAADLFRTRPEWIVPILAVPLLLTLFHLFFHAKDRFHMPLAAVMALLAAVGDSPKSCM